MNTSTTQANNPTATTTATVPEVGAVAVSTAANDAPAESFEHIDPRLRSLMRAPLAARIRRALSDVLIMHPQLVGVLNEIEWLIREPDRMRPRGILLVADAGSGKSAIADHISKSYPCDAVAGQGKKPRVVTISMSGARKTKDVLNRIMAATGAPVSRRYTTSDHQSLVLETLRRMNCRLVVLDECQDIVQIPEREQLRVLESLKYTMNSLRMPILALGTDPARQAFKVDPHLQARFDTVEMPRWDVGDDFAAFLDAYELCLPLKFPSQLSSERMQKALIKVSGGILDKILTRLRQVAVSAMVDGTERVTVEVIEKGVARPVADILGPR